MIHKLIVFCCVVDWYIEPTYLHIFRLCFLFTFLELLAKFYWAYMISRSGLWTACTPAGLDHSTKLMLAIRLSFQFLLHMLDLTLIRTLKVILAGCVVGSHR